MYTLPPEDSDSINYFTGKEDEIQEGVEFHAMTIIGWDDNYSKDNFKSPTGLTPKKDGAYILYNSWGGENQYVYISYEDYLVHTGLSGILSTDIDELICLNNMKNVKLSEYIEHHFSKDIIYNNGKKYISPIILQNVYELDLVSVGLNSLDEIEIFENLYSLDISRNNIQDLNNLKSLTKLSELNLSYCDISDISILAELKDLYKLDLSGNTRISDYDVLSKLELEELNMSYCNLNDISFLKNINNLKTLDLSGNANISNLSLLSEMKIENLILRNCNITSIITLVNAKKITTLDLSQNKSLNYNELKELNYYITNLILRDCDIKDAGVVKIKGLTELDLSENHNISCLNELELVTSLKISDCNLTEVPDFSKNSFLK